MGYSKCSICWNFSYSSPLGQDLSESRSWRIMKESESVSHSVESDSLWAQGLWPARLLCPWDSPGKKSSGKPLTIGEYMVWQHPSSNGDVHQPHVMRSVSCFLICAAELRSSLHSQFQCWCPLNFKSSSKFPRPSAALSNTTPSWIYPYISWLIGSATQLQALREHFSNRFGGSSCASPLILPSLHHQGYWSFSPVVLHWFAWGKEHVCFCLLSHASLWGPFHTCLRTCRNLPFPFQRATHIVLNNEFLETL